MWGKEKLLVIIIFSFSHNVFKMLIFFFFLRVVKVGIVWERVKVYTVLYSVCKTDHTFNSLPYTLNHTIPTFNNPEINLLKTLWEKEKILVTSIFSFPTIFSTLPKTDFNFSVKFNLSSANAFSFDQSKNLLFGKELKDIPISYDLDIRPFCLLGCSKSLISLVVRWLSTTGVS